MAEVQDRYWIPKLWKVTKQVINALATKSFEQPTFNNRNLAGHSKVIGFDYLGPVTYKKNPKQRVKPMYYSTHVV